MTYIFWWGEKIEPIKDIYDNDEIGQIDNFNNSLKGTIDDDILEKNKWKTFADIWFPEQGKIGAEVTIDIQKALTKVSIDAKVVIDFTYKIKKDDFNKYFVPNTRDKVYFYRWIWFLDQLKKDSIKHNNEILHFF